MSRQCRMLVGLGDEELESGADEGEGRVTEVAMKPAVSPLVLGVSLAAVVYRWPERRIGSDSAIGLEVIGTNWISECLPRSVFIDI